MDLALFTDVKPELSAMSTAHDDRCIGSYQSSTPSSSTSAAATLCNTLGQHASPIHRLPPEILGHILDLLDKEADGAQVESYKLGLSVVARAWANMGQRALAAEVAIWSRVELNRFSTSLFERSKRTDAPLLVGEMLVSEADGAVFRRMIIEGNLQVRHLSVFTCDDEFPWDALHLLGAEALSVRSAKLELTILLTALKSLWVLSALPTAQNKQVVRSRLTGIKLDMRFTDQPVPPLRQLFVASASTLQTLELIMYGRSARSEVPEDVILMLQDAAPSIQTLSIELWTASSPTLNRLLPNFTNMRCLRLSVAYTRAITTILDLVRSPLAVLETRVRDEPVDAAVLHPYLELKALASLRRWRFISRWNERVDDEVWVVKCQEKGIELRDGRRFFTD